MIDDLRMHVIGPERKVSCTAAMDDCKDEIDLRRISCHGRNYSQPYFFKRNQSSDNRSHGFGAKFLLKKLSVSDFSYERKSALILLAFLFPS